MTTPAYANSLKARTENFGATHQKITDEVNATGKKGDPPTVPPSHVYGWQHYYKKPKWKDFEPSAGLADRLDSAPPPPPRRFKHDTPGQVMLTLLHEAHARGALLTIHADFTETKDSAGRHWHHGDKDPNRRRGFVSGTINHKFDPGTTLLGVAQWMAEEGFAEARMRHRTLQLFLPKKGDDLTNTVVLSAGRNLVDGPKSSTTRDLVTDVYVLSESGVHGWVGDQGARKKWGRIEAIQNLNSVRTWEEAEDRGKRHLDKMKDPRSSYTYGIVPDAGANPYKDYGIGDYVTVVDANGKPVKHRVREIGLAWSDDQVAIAATMSDVLLSERVKHHRRHRTQHGKSSSTTTGRNFVSDEKSISDDLSPNPPSAPRITSKAGTVKVHWDGTDEDGAPPVWDQAFVEVHVGTSADFEPDETTFTERLHAAGASIFNDLDYDTQFYFKFVAVDEGGDRSPPSEEIASAMAQVTNADIGAGAVGNGELGDDVPVGTDGLPPTTSPDPTIVGVPRLLIIKWLGIANADAVMYEVHISTTTGFTPGPTTLAQQTGSTYVAVESLPDGSALLYNVIYYVKIIAKDDDGAAAPSNESFGQLDPAGTADIAVGSITAANLEAVLILAGTIATASTGRRVEISNTSGIVVWDSNGDALVSFPTDSTSQMFLNGDVVAKSLSILDNMNVQGLNNIVSKGGVVTLQANTSTPKSPPTAVVSWDYVDYNDNPALSEYKYGFYWDSTPSEFLFCRDYFGGIVLRYNTSGTYLGGWALADVPNPFSPVGGITRLGSNYYILGKYLTSDGVARAGWWVGKYSTAGAFVSEWRWNDGDNPGSGSGINRPCLGNNGTNLLIAQCRSSDGRITVREYATTSNTQVGSTKLSASSVNPDIHLSGVMYGSFDFGGNRYIVSPAEPNGNKQFWVFTEASGVLTNVANERWEYAENNRPAGLTHDGTNFWSHSLGQSRMHKYQGSGNKWTTESDMWWVSYTFEDTDATGGLHETDQGPRISLTMKRRAKLILTAGAIPDAGGTDDADSVNFYVGRGSSDPGRTAMWLNASPASGVINAEVKNAVFTAVANPPSTNGFLAVAATPAVLKSSAVRTASGTPMTNLKGDGTGNLDAVVPVGVIFMWIISTIPTGFLKLDGTDRSRTTYADLFALWGTTFGTGDGSTTFGTPDMRGRAPFGAGSNVSIGVGEGKSEANRGPSHTHNVTNHGGHIHTIPAASMPTNTNGSTGGAAYRITGGDAHTHGGTDSGGSHDHGGNTGNSASDPIGYMGVNFIVKT